MNTAQLRKQTKAMLNDLSASQLRLANEFLAFDKSRRFDAETLELLLIPGFEASYSRGLYDIKFGRTKSWRTVRAYYRAGQDVEDNAWAKATSAQSQSAWDED